jgi:CRISPR system Cascade subunit CasE
MHLSLLEVDPRSHIARTWLGNPYRVHQRLLMAFPNADPGRVLFRIEDEWAPPRIIVQSEAEAEWAAAFGDFAVLASPVQQKTLSIDVAAGDVLRFRLRANPTKRLSAGCPGKKVDGARVGLFKEEDQRAWMERKASSAGFELLFVEVRPLSTIVSRKNPAKDRARQSHLAVQFNGRLRVTDPRELEEAVRCGVGSAKAYGFGLLSLAR